ncbi:unnamed protein product [Mytilus edulis]|uniref:UMOD/GP2/OIT3-like D8C domain-containing protein n=1 Tax=Mytilus edulis TaxID=6550 RepID=A0A8S3UHY3_MYTED|nr:unnamed protein product [Mytilus edulis]
MIHTNTETMTFMPGEYNNVLFLDYHFSTHYIFWSDYDGFAIYRLPYRPGFRTTAEKIITAKRPAGVAVDGINDHLYWAENGGYQIYRSNLDGSNNTVIIKLSSPPLDLELDIPNRLLYCTTDNLGNEEILKCSLDDGNCQVLFPTSQLGVNIAIDFEENRMYWTSYDPTSYIKSSFFDGSNLRSIGIKNNAFGIDVSITHIYYGDMSKGLWKVEKANSTNEVLLYADNRVSAVKVFKPRDECSSDKTVANANKRSSDYILDTSEDTVLSDHDLEMKWYRIISDNGDMMPTSAPGCNHCGTVNPIWLNGSMPIYDEGTVTRAACLQTKEDICKSTIDIQIRICGSYYLYYLQSSPENSSFCFGNGKVSCPAGMSSETGYYPGCTSKLLYLLFQFKFWMKLHSIENAFKDS